jgi:threonine/homoserine/homoserine lactone efflux protein
MSHLRGGNQHRHVVHTFVLSPQGRVGLRTGFRQGLLNNLLNPKAGLIFVTVVPQFIRLGDSALRLALMLLAYEAVLLAWLGLYGTLIGRAARLPVGTRMHRILAGAIGATLIALAVHLALAKPRPRTRPGRGPRPPGTIRHPCTKPRRLRGAAVAAHLALWACGS